MEVKKKTGIYFCSANGHADALKITDLKSWAGNIPGVEKVWDTGELNLKEAEELAKEIKNAGVERIVLTGETPGMDKTIFSKAMAKAGNNPADVLLAGFKEYGITNGEHTDKAKALLSSTVYGVNFEDATIPEKTNVCKTTLVIGGGIAGIQASLEIADANEKVVLVEQTGTIGGHMAMFDKTFPTLDCAACILTPKMVEVGQHSNIDLLTYSEIKEVTGEPGNYKVKVLKKARYIDLATCIGCGTCSDVCPVKVPSEFDADTSFRKVAYIPFPQAVPNKYLIDAANCGYIQEEKCGVCQKKCPVPDCIDFNDKDEIMEITVGNIIVATGFKTFDAKKAEQFGYGKYPNVLTSLEFERLINAAGPTGGNVVERTQDKKGNWIFQDAGEIPQSVALIHCVGSRDANYNKYCSKVCCMYSLKLAHLVKEKIPTADVFEYYIDMRAFGKGYEEFYERIKNEDINIIRGRTAKVEGKGKKLAIRSEDIEGQSLIEQEVDMVILAVGLEPRDDAKKLANMLDISVDEDGWFNEAHYIGDPVGTYTGGITIAGVCQGPKDIPDTVAQGSAAASKVVQSLINGEIEKSRKHMKLEHIVKQAEELAQNMENKS